MKKDCNNSETIYFLGIGGIGMSALAHFYLQQGKKILGYDATKSAITLELENKGAAIVYDQNALPEDEQIDCVVFTPAIAKSALLFQYFLTLNISMYKRSEVLGMLCANYPTLAISGTHGKTTTSAIATYLLNDQPIMALVGGVMNDTHSNYWIQDKVESVIVEADEFDRSFLTLYPKTLVVTCIEADHLDIYGDEAALKDSFQQLVNQVDEDGNVIVYEPFAEEVSVKNKWTYGFSDNANFQVKNVQLELNYALFDLILHDKNGTVIAQYSNIRLGITGLHNVLNAVGALFACSLHSSIKMEDLWPKLAHFKGVKRRFDVRVERADFVYIDDYAHHPTEIENCGKSVRALYPEKKITAIFQPHLFSRTQDFAAEFANALAIFDEVWLLEIYPARELPIEGINAQFLLDLIPISNKIVVTKESIPLRLQAQLPEVLLTLGAGDIDQLVSVIEKF